VGARDEQLFISSILRQEDHVTPLTNGVTAEWFFHFRSEWEWIARYIDRHRSCPSKTLFKSKFSNFLILKVDDVEFTTGELRDAFLNKMMIRTMDSALDSIEERKNPQRVLEDLQKALVQLHGEVSTTSNESDVVEEWESVFNEVSRRSEKANERGMAGLPTGFSTLDLATNGPQPGDFFVVAARLGQGKTWTLIRMAAASLMAGATVQYDALEQSKSQIAMRVHTFLQSENAKEMFTTAELMSGKGVDLIAYKKFLKKLKADLPGKLIVDDTSRGKVSPASIAAQLERNRPDILFLDYLTLMSGASDWQKISELSGELKGIAQAYEVPIVAAAQINRASYDSGHPGTQHLAGSDSIGQDADAVITMAQQSRHVIKFHLAKYRHGADGQFWFTEFRPNSGQFTEISGDAAQELIDEDRLAEL